MEEYIVTFNVPEENKEHFKQWLHSQPWDFRSAKISEVFGSDASEITERDVPKIVKEVGEIDTGGITIEDRTWLSGSIVNSGGHITDGGFGCGGADLGYTLNGRSFSVNMKFRDEKSEAA